jgi:hypothetical protein
VQNHPFVDGNKRTGFVVGVLFLELNGYRFTASEEAAAQAVLGVVLSMLQSEMSRRESRRPICASMPIRGGEKFRRRRSARATIVGEVAYSVGTALGHPIGYTHELRQGSGTHLPHDLTAMNLHRHLAQIELGGDLLVRLPVDDESHGLSLALSQGGVAPPQIGDESGVSAPFPIAPDRRLDRIEQVLILEGLGQEVDGASLHRPNAHPNVPMARDKDYR